MQETTLVRHVRLQFSALSCSHQTICALIFRHVETISSVCVVEDGLEKKQADYTDQPNNLIGSLFVCIH